MTFLSSIKLKFSLPYLNWIWSNDLEGDWYPILWDDIGWSEDFIRLLLLLILLFFKGIVVEELSLE